ncbi:unnamed protein product [Cuscuta epithymum]|uniref:Uncharacterized protein n=1 Tax=Cuscuta epithymum TaxID=186058 RepID=A0AAV0FB66_9ASTE|nr:unnamed protein product [Cuscuta epithymum]CAH9132611.1 unnamed protein product [Cuscuta epithymum]
MPEKTEYTEQDKKGGKMRVQLNLGKSGGIFVLLGGLLVTVLLSSAFRKRRKPTGKVDGGDENGPEKSAAAEEESGMGDDGERINGDGEEPARQGIQFILSSPSSLLNDELRIKDRDNLITVQACEEQQDSLASGCDDQEIFTNNSSIPATSCEQENSSQSFGNHHLVLEEVSLDNSSEEGTLNSGDFINIIKTDSFSTKQEEMEILRGDSDQKNTSFEHLGDFQVNEKNTDLVSNMNVPTDITTSQMEMNLEDDTAISTVQKTPTVIVNLTEKGSEKEKLYASVMPSNEKEGEEIVDDHKSDDGDGGLYDHDGVSRNLEDNTPISTAQEKPTMLVNLREVQEDIVDNDDEKVHSSVIPSNDKEDEEIVDEHEHDDDGGNDNDDDGVFNQKERNLEDNTLISTVQKKPTMLVNLREVQEDIVDNDKEKVHSSFMPSNEKEGDEIVDDHKRDDGDLYDDDGVSNQMERNLEDNTPISTMQKKPTMLVNLREVQADIVDNVKEKGHSSVIPSNDKEGEEMVDVHKCDDCDGDVYDDDGVTNQMERNLEDNTPISTVQKKPTMLINLTEVQEDIVGNVKEKVHSSVIPSNDKKGEEIVDEHEHDDDGGNDNGNNDVVDDHNHSDNNNNGVVDGYGDGGIHNGVSDEMEIDIEEDTLISTAQKKQTMVLVRDRDENDEEKVNLSVQPSNDQEGEENDDDYDDDDDDYSDRDGSEGISDESDDGVGTEAIWPELPEVEDRLLGLNKGPYINEETVEEDGSINAESYITVWGRVMKMNIILDRLVTYLFLSKRRTVAGTIAWLIVYSCIVAIALIFVLPNFLNV